MFVVCFDNLQWRVRDAVEEALEMKGNIYIVRFNVTLMIPIADLGR